MDTEDVVQSQDAAAATPVAPEHDGAPGWRVTLYTVWVAQILAMLGFAFVMPFMPYYIRELGVTDPRLVPVWAGLLTGGSGIVMALVAPLWGWVADHYGRKPMVQRAMFGGAAVISLMGLVKTAPQLLALRALQGGITGTVSASVALVSSVVPRAHLAFSLGLMQMAVFTGNSLGPVVGGTVADRYGYRVPFAVTGVLLLLAGALVLVGARERFVRPSPAQRRQSGSLKDVLAQPGVPGLLMLYLLINLSGSFVGPIFPLFVEEVAGVTKGVASTTGWLMMVTGITGALAAVLAGKLSDRLGHARVLIACTAFSGVLCLPQAAVTNLGQLFVLRALAGIASGGMSPSLNAMVAARVRRTGLGRAYGLTVTASSIGWAVGPAIGGWTASLLGLRPPFVIMGGMLLAMVLVVRRIARADD